MPRKDQTKSVQLSKEEKRLFDIEEKKHKLVHGLIALGYDSTLSADLATNLSRLQNGQGAVQADRGECRLDLQLSLKENTGTATMILKKPTSHMPFAMFIDRPHQPALDWIHSLSAIVFCKPSRGLSHQDCVDLNTAGGSLIRFSRDVSGALAFETVSK